MAAALAACTRFDPVPPGAVITCGDTAECPAGLVCHGGLCLEPSPENLTAPALAGDARTTPALGKAGTTFTIGFEATKALSEPPRVTLGLVPPVALPCAPTTGNGWQCAYVATGLENGGRGGVIAFDVSLRDRAGNEKTEKLAGAFTLDLEGPAIAAEAVIYLPASDNPLPRVAQATAGTAVEVTVVASELLDLLDPATLPSLSVGAGGPSFELDRGRLGESSATFRAVIPPGTPDGTYPASVRWADLAGNARSEALATGVVVKTSLPVLAVDQEKVSYLRSPWGNAAPEPLRPCPACDPVHVVSAGPHFELAPADALSATNGLQAGAFLIGGAPPAAVRIWSDAGRSVLLGMAFPRADGTWPRTSLQRVDTLSAWVTGLDGAGNESAPVQLQHAEWVATPNPPTFGVSPVTLSLVGFASPTRALAADTPQAGGAAAGGADADAILASAEMAWRERTPATTTVPTGALTAAMAYDSARGRVVLFGGQGSAGVAQDTWEWDGRLWTRANPIGPLPQARYGHAMAYDAARGRVVLFGGVGSVYLQDTWEWDGTAWKLLSPAGPIPAARQGPSMAYDASRRRVLLFGGAGGAGFLPDTWEWDGASWTQVAIGAAAPPGRNYAGLVFDHRRARAVLFGGQGTGGIVQDLWEWDGVGWASVTPAGGRPAPRVTPAMAYDGSRGRVVLFGGGGIGGADLGDTWTWDGAAWTSVTPAGRSPPARRNAALAYAADRERVVLFGGRLASGVATDTWEWDGARWLLVAPGPSPSARSGHALAYDAGRQRVVLFGGFGSTDTWEWDGVAWTSVTPASGSPSARRGTAMVYEAARGRVLLFGGGTNYGSPTFSDTWAWNGATWTNLTPALPAASPPSRWSHAMAYDPARGGRVVLFGGEDLGLLGDTWEWNGTAWANVTPAGTRPAARARHAMAHDASGAGRVIVSGGYDGAQLRGDTWAWSGSAWQDVTPPGPSPAGRVGAAMASDAARRRVLLFGGSDLTAYRGDTWEWDGAAWTEVTPRGSSPSGRIDTAMAWDAARGRAVLFGGGPGSLQDTWELDPQGRPAIQLDVSTAQAGPVEGAVEAIRVRAFAGGVDGAGVAGATLLGWLSRGVNGEPGGWAPLAAGGTGASAEPRLPAPPASLISWSAASPDEGRSLLAGRDARLSFQVRPSEAGTGAGRAKAALDYLEVRVRYRAP